MLEIRYYLLAGGATTDCYLLLTGVVTTYCSLEYSPSCWRSSERKGMPPSLRKYCRVAPADWIILPRAVTKSGVSIGRSTPCVNWGEKPLRHSHSHSGSIWVSSELRVCRTCLRPELG